MTERVDGAVGLFQVEDYSPQGDASDITNNVPMGDTIVVNLVSVCIALIRVSLEIDMRMVGVDGS